MLQKYNEAVNKAKLISWANQFSRSDKEVDTLKLDEKVDNLADIETTLFTAVFTAYPTLKGKVKAKYKAKEKIWEVQFNGTLDGTIADFDSTTNELTLYGYKEN